MFHENISCFSGDFSFFPVTAARVFLFKRVMSTYGADKSRALRFRIYPESHCGVNIINVKPKPQKPQGGKSGNLSFLRRTNGDDKSLL